MALQHRQRLAAGRVPQPRACHQPRRSPPCAPSGLNAADLTTASWPCSTASSRCAPAAASIQSRLRLDHIGSIGLGHVFGQRFQREQHAVRRIAARGLLLRHGFARNARLRPDAPCSFAERVCLSRVGTPGCVCCCAECQASCARRLACFCGSRASRSSGRRPRSAARRWPPAIADASDRRLPADAGFPKPRRTRAGRRAGRRPCDRHICARDRAAAAARAFPSAARCRSTPSPRPSRRRANRMLSRSWSSHCLSSDQCSNSASWATSAMVLPSLSAASVMQPAIRIGKDLEHPAHVGFGLTRGDHLVDRRPAAGVPGALAEHGHRQEGAPGDRLLIAAEAVVDSLGLLGQRAADAAELTHRVRRGDALPEAIPDPGQDELQRRQRALAAERLLDQQVDRAPVDLAAGRASPALRSRGAARPRPSPARRTFCRAIRRISSGCWLIAPRKSLRSVRMTETRPRGSRAALQQVADERAALRLVVAQRIGLLELVDQQHDRRPPPTSACARRESGGHRGPRARAGPARTRIAFLRRRRIVGRLPGQRHGQGFERSRLGREHDAIGAAGRPGRGSRSSSASSPAWATEDLPEPDGAEDRQQADRHLAVGRSRRAAR